METVVPLSGARGVAIEPVDALAEGAELDEALALVGKHTAHGAIFCTHGDVMWELVEDLTRRHVLAAFKEEFAKGSTWVIETVKGIPVRARYIPAP